MLAAEARRWGNQRGGRRHPLIAGPDGHKRLTNTQKIERALERQQKQESEAAAPYYWVKG